jgi:hypothetical protein
MFKDDSFLRAALVGYEAKFREVQEKIEEIQRRLGRPKAATGAQTKPVLSWPRRPMSAESRKRIADAQKKRWAAYYAAKKSDD